MNKVFVDRPVWAVGDDFQFIWTEEELSAAIDYTLFAQDRKGLDWKSEEASPGSYTLSAQVGRPSSHQNADTPAPKTGTENRG